MEKDYARLIAAQNESARRIKIQNIQNTLSYEQKKKRDYAIATGICIVGTTFASLYAGISPTNALQSQIHALSSFDALKDYLESFTPAKWVAIIATATNIINYIKHNDKYNKANADFYAMMDHPSENYQDIVENQAKSK